MKIFASDVKKKSWVLVNNILCFAELSAIFVMYVFDPWIIMYVYFILLFKYFYIFILKIEIKETSYAIAEDDIRVSRT